MVNRNNVSCYRGDAFGREAAQVLRNGKVELRQPRRMLLFNYESK